MRCWDVLPSFVPYIHLIAFHKAFLFLLHEAGADLHVGIWAREEELLLDGDGKGPGAPVDPGLVCPALPGPALGGN